MRLFFLLLVLVFCRPAYASMEDAEKAFQTGDYPKAAALLMPLAEAGNSRAQANLGLMYGQGIGVARNEAKGVQWTRRAAEAGNAKAQANLGLFYYHGTGVERNFEQAAVWLEKAANQGNSGAQATLGVLYLEGQGVPKNYARARSLSEAAIKDGNSGAANNLARMVEYGLGVASNPKSAMDLYEIAAKAGDAAAQNRLGLAYLNGEFREKNAQLAREWFLKSAVQGQKHGLYHYALLLLESNPIDKIPALTLLSVSAKQGYEPAALEIGRHAQALAQTEKDRLERSVSQWRPSGNGAVDPEVVRVQAPLQTDPFSKARQLYSCYHFFKAGTGGADPAQTEKLVRISSHFLIRATTEVVALDPDKNPANTKLAAQVGRQGLENLKSFLSQVDGVADSNERNRMMGQFANTCASAAGARP